MKGKLVDCGVKLILCLLATMLLSSCLGGREVNDLEIVIGMGIDKAENKKDILVTAQIVKAAEMGMSKGNGGGEGSKAFWNVAESGGSVFEAVRQLTHKTGNRLFVSHNQAIIFSNDIALEGLDKYIDFFLRAHEMRPTALILIAEGRASDILDTKPETAQLPAINIAELVKSYGYTSHFLKVNMNDFASGMMNTATAPIAPLVSVTRDNGSRDVYVSGMAVFKNGKMVGKLNEDETRGLLWVLGKVKSGVITIPSPNNKGKVVMEIVGAKSKVVPKIKGGKIVMHVTIKGESGLVEQSANEKLADLEAFEKMQNAQAEVIQREIIAAFNKSLALNADIFGLGEKLHKKFSKEWKEYKDKWDEIYPTIELDLKVETKILKTDLLKKPAAPGKE